MKARTQEPRQKKKAGMTLLEVLFAITIFAAGMIGVNAVYIQGFQIFDVSRDNSDISQILQNRMEALRSISYTQVGNQSGTTVFTATDLGLSNIDQSTGAPNGWGAFSLTQTISTAATGLYSVTLQADWTNRYDDAASMVFTTHIMDGGLNDFFTRTAP